MYLGKVVGTVVSTTKNEALVGFKLLVIKKLDEHLGITDNSEVVVDSVGAGVGEIVLVSKTTKNEALVGFKLLVIKKLDEHLGITDNSEVVVDSVGAGVGEIVLVSKGSSARYVLEREKAPIDSAVVAIVDTVEVNG